MLAPFMELGSPAVGIIGGGMRRLAADGRAGSEGGSDAARPAEDEVLGGEEPDVRDQGGDWREG